MNKPLKLNYERIYNSFIDGKKVGKSWSDIYIPGGPKIIYSNDIFEIQSKSEYESWHQGFNLTCPDLVKREMNFVNQD